MPTDCRRTSGWRHKAKQREYLASCDLDLSPWNERERTVTHQVEHALFPNWSGSHQKRSYRFADGRLILSTPPIRRGGREVTARTPGGPNRPELEAGPRRHTEVSVG